MAKRGRPKKPAIPADWYIKFTGAMPVVNVPEPQKGDRLEFTVVGDVWKLEDARRGDGEDRVAWSIALTDVWPAGTERPASANQALMFDTDGNATAEAAEASADEGDEIMAERAEAAAAEPDPYDQDDERNAKGGK